MTIVERHVLDGMMLKIIEHAEEINKIASKLSDTAKYVDGASNYVSAANRANKAMIELAANLISV